MNLINNDDCYSFEILNPLVGKQITGVRVEKGGEKLAFDTNAGQLSLEVTGDCCSHSWIEHIEGVRNLVGATVLSVSDRDMPGGIEDEEYEYLQFYGYDIKTDKGNFYFEFRNSSNGYYGGGLENYKTVNNEPFCTEDF